MAMHFLISATEGAVILCDMHGDMQDDYLSQHCCLYNDFLNIGVIYFIAFRHDWHPSVMTDQPPCTQTDDALQ